MVVLLLWEFYSCSLSVGSAHNSRRLFLETREGTVASSLALMHIQPIDHRKYEALNLDGSDENGKQDTELEQI